MWPLAAAKPKHLLSVAGKPLISHVIRGLSDCGITDVFIVVGFKGEMIQSALGDGAAFGVRIHYLHQTEWT